MKIMKKNIRTDHKNRIPSNKNAFAFRLKHALRVRKLLTSDIAEKTGISKKTLRLYMTSQSMPSKKRLVKIAKDLHVAPAWLLGLMPLEACNHCHDANTESDVFLTILHFYIKGDKL